MPSILSAIMICFTIIHEWKIATVSILCLTTAIWVQEIVSYHYKRLIRQRALWRLPLLVINRFCALIKLKNLQVDIRLTRIGQCIWQFIGQRWRKKRENILNRFLGNFVRTNQRRLLGSPSKRSLNHLLLNSYLGRYFSRDHLALLDFESRVFDSFSITVRFFFIVLPFWLKHLSLNWKNVEKA